MKKISKGEEMRYGVEWKLPDEVWLDNFGPWSDRKTAYHHIRMCQRESRRYPARYVIWLGTSGRPPARGEWIEPLPVEEAADVRRW